MQDLASAQAAVRELSPEALRGLELQIHSQIATLEAQRRRILDVVSNSLINVVRHKESMGLKLDAVRSRFQSYRDALLAAPRIQMPVPALAPASTMNLYAAPASSVNASFAAESGSSHTVPAPAATAGMGTYAWMPAHAPTTTSSGIAFASSATDASVMNMSVSLPTASPSDSRMPAPAGYVGVTSSSTQHASGAPHGSAMAPSFRSGSLGSNSMTLAFAPSMSSSGYAEKSFSTGVVSSAHTHAAAAWPATSSTLFTSGAPRSSGMMLGGSTAAAGVINQRQQCCLPTSC
ncbi:MAG: hypothetical protein EOO41_03265, partial [Methanobacteriota archaeon]